jgi:raffinose/stachyose/melibiose transport system permease protein
MGKSKMLKENMYYSPGKNVSIKIQKILLNTILLVFSFSCIFPIIWILYSSFKTQNQFMLSSIGLPSSLDPTNYLQVFTQTKMGLYMLNSLRNTLLSVAGIILLAFLVGYLLARFTFIGRKFIYNYFLLGMLIPIHALLVPIYIQFKSAGLIDHWYTLLFPYIAFGMPIAVLLVESFVKMIPGELEEAAAIDGSSFSRTLFTIILPLTMPVLATVAIIQFFSVWNEFSFALILVNKDLLRTVPVGLTTFKSEYVTNYPRMMAAIMITMLPVMILYFVFSKRIIEGMTAGAIKG